MLNNYVNKKSVYGLMNRFCILCSNIFGFWKTRNHTKLVSFDETITGSPNKVSFMYLEQVTKNEEYWKTKGYAMSKPVTESEIYSIINDDAVNPSRRTNKELYETIRHYTGMQKFTVESWDDSLYDDVVSMINEWSSTIGQKYGFRRHDGIDKAVFLRLMKHEIDPVHYQILIFKYDNKIVGYSVSENNKDNDGEIVYLIRKCIRKIDNKTLRNLGLYIDWYTFYKLHKLNGDYIINWGCSSGGVRKYKINKWPLYKEKPLWFYGLTKIIK